MLKAKEKQARTITPAESSYKIKKMIIMSLISAMAYVIVMVCRLPIIPSAGYLDLEFKSAVILIGAYIFGPLSGFVMSVVICFVEMVTFSTTGLIGCIMNLLATACFVCPAAFVYKKKNTTVGAVVGIALGAITMTVAMVLWNYILTPLYQGIPRDVIAAMLLPVFVPFNMIKACLNGGVALFLYRFVIVALQKANLIPKSEEQQNEKNGGIIGAVIIGCFIIVTCSLIIFAINGLF